MSDAHKFIRNKYKAMFHMAIESNGVYSAACGAKFNPYTIVVEDEMPFYGFRCNKCYPGLDRITLEVSVNAAFALRRSDNHRLYAELLIESIANMPLEVVTKTLDGMLGTDDD